MCQSALEVSSASIQVEADKSNTNRNIMVRLHSLIRWSTYERSRHHYYSISQ